MTLIIDAGSSKVPAIRKCVLNFGSTCDIKTIDQFQKSDVEKASHIIISGSPLLFIDRDLNKLKNRGQDIFLSHKKILGICFGHQWMGLCYGSRVELGKESRKPVPIAFLEDSPIFEKLKSGVSMAQDHCEHASVPNDFRLLANSEDCDNEAMQHSAFHHYGVQFHPEDSGANGQTLIDNFLKL